MPKYKCSCKKKETLDVKGVTIKMVDGKAVHDVKCSCGEYMDLAEPKTGVASFGSDRYGRVR